MSNNDPRFTEEARALAAQCWCDEETSDIEMDTRLADAFARRLEHWMEDAARYARNSDFHRDLVDQCATHLGVRAYTADDGSVMEDPVRLRVPELVAELAAKQLGDDSPVADLGGSVLPQLVSEDGTGATPVTEVTVVTAMSGGADEVDGMPRTLTLLRKRQDRSDEYRRRYVQDPSDPSNEIVYAPAR